MKYKSYDVIIKTDKYQNRRMAILLLDVVDSSVVSRVTVNLPELDINFNEAAIKNYSENEGILFFLLSAGLVESIVGYATSGHINKIPICKMNLKKLCEYDSKFIEYIKMHQLQDSIES